MFICLDFSECCVSSTVKFPKFRILCFGVCMFQISELVDCSFLKLFRFYDVRVFDVALAFQMFAHQLFGCLISSHALQGPPLQTQQSPAGI